MSRLSLLSLFLALAAPAVAKPYPLPCSDLWNAVTDTLGNPGNYTIVAIDNEHMKASFIVVGSLYPAGNSVFLKAKGDGCELETRMGFTGNDDGFALRSRVNRALAKRKAANLPTPASSDRAGE
jgi:hypothetical protein